VYNPWIVKICAKRVGQTLNVPSQNHVLQSAKSRQFSRVANMIILGGLVSSSSESLQES